MKTTKEIKAEFQHFLDSIPENLETLKEKLNLDQLQFSFEEINAVEKWYTTYHKRPDQVGLTKEKLDLICTAYFGTAYIWYFGGEWELETRKAGDFGAFHIVRYGGSNYHWVAITPQNWLFFIETKQAENSIASIFEGLIEFYERRANFVFGQFKNQ